MKGYCIHFKSRCDSELLLQKCLHSAETNGIQLKVVVSEHGSVLDAHRYVWTQCLNEDVSLIVEHNVIFVEPLPELICEGIVNLAYDIKREKYYLPIDSREEFALVDPPFKLVDFSAYLISNLGKSIALKRVLSFKRLDILLHSLGISIADVYPCPVFIPINSENSKNRLSRDDVDVYIFNWNGQTTNARNLVRWFLNSGVNVRVVNCDETTKPLNEPDWIHLKEDAYYGAQFDAALARFDREVLLCCTADAILAPIHIHAMVDRILECFGCLDCGVFAPIDLASAWQFDLTRLKNVGNGYYEVPNTDCTCWAISRKVLERYKELFLPVTKYGWGIDLIMASIASELGLSVVRDYWTIITQPTSTGYDKGLAGKEMDGLIESLPDALRLDVLYRLKQLGTGRVAT